MRVLVVPDSFKGSLSAVEVCEAIAAGLEDAIPGVTVVQLPVADGGEGTVYAFLLAVGGERRTERVAGPYGAPVDADWALLPDGTAVVEMAAAAGLPLVGTDRRTADASTFGVGELLRAAAAAGAARILLGIGGSATTDGGCGAAAACGVRFLTADKRSFVPTGGTLHEIARIDVSGFDLGGTPLEAMCDVDNPLTGALGAAAVFGPQKGADPEKVRMLDAGLAHLSAVIRRDLGVDVETLPGAGAAGGLGAGVVAFLGGTLRRGVDAVLDAVGFDDMLGGADLVVTGEGSFDAQSLRGKVVHGVAARARARGVPVHVIAGRVDEEVLPHLRDLGISAADAVTPPGMPFEEARTRAPELLRAAARRLAASGTWRNCP